jgi:hypothetical protein
MRRTLVEGTDRRPIELPYEIAFEPTMPQSLRVVIELLEVSRKFRIIALERVILDSLKAYGIRESDIEKAAGLYEKKIVREETFSRRGANSTDIKTNLSEQSFYYAMKNAIDEGKITEVVAKENFSYIYPILKVVFDDNVLDDDNNIVNFSSSRDIPVLRLRFRYTYA